jgi:hypothetical protein
MKWLLYGFIGFVLFGFGGLILGSGDVHYLNKTQRGVANDYGYVWIVAFIGSIIGLIIGIRLSEEEKNNKKLGINDLSILMNKEGRYWNMTTEWINPASSNVNIIKTIKYNNEICTFFNDSIVKKHGHNSASKKEIERSHKSGVYDIFTNLRNGDLAHLI